MLSDRGQGGPTVRRMLLGGQLRRLRDGQGVSRAQAAAAIGGSESKISRLELGRLPFKARDVAALLTRYGVPDEERRALLEMARYANAPGWWHRYSDVLPGWFQTYVGLESATSQIRTYEAQFIPGLLQTEAYARAVTRTGRSPRTAREVNRRVAVRRSRQLVLSRPETKFWAVIDEGALRRPVGGPEVMHEQLTHLLRLQERANVSIQVLPFAIGGHAGEVGAFSILRFAEPDLPDIVYLEHLTGALYLDKLDEVEQYLQVFTQLSVVSPPPEDTAAALTKIMSGY